MRFTHTHTFTLLVTGLAALFFTTSCHPRATLSSTSRYSFADSVTVDSLTLWQERVEADRTTVRAYIMDSLAPVYSLRGSQLYLDTVLRLTDPLTVRGDQFVQYFEGKYYPVTYHGRQGYIKGTSLGYGISSDFDNDGKSDLVLYGYSRYVQDTAEENSFNPLAIKFVSATGAVSVLSDTAYSYLSMSEVQGVRLSRQVHCYELTSGYPACGYPQLHFVIAFGQGKAEIIHRSVSSMDSGLGDFCEFTYPVDSTHHVDTIYISHRLALPISDSNDTIVYSTLDSTILYLHEGTWGQKVYKMDPASN